MMSPGVKTPHGLKTQDSQQHMSVWEAGGVNSVFFFSFLLFRVARGLLVPQPGVNYAPL